MRVHVTHDIGTQPRIAHGIAHHAEAAFMLRSRLGHVICVAAHAVANDFSQDRSVALASVFQLFQDQDACAFADDKAVAVLVPRPAGFFGIVIARGKSAHSRESANTHGSDCGFRAAGYHDIGVVVLNDAEGIADGMCAGSAGRSGSFIGSLCTIAHGNVPSRQIDDCRGNEEGRYLARAAFHQRGMLALDDVETSDARADMDPNPFVILWSDFEAGHLHGFVRGRDSQMDETSHLFQFFFLDELQRVEVLDLGRDLASKIAGIELGDACNPAVARK